MIAFIKSGVELAYETMLSSGIKAESAYYESLHELPLIANVLARKKLYEMNRIISDTAEYGCYLFNNSCKSLLVDFMKNIKKDVIGDVYLNQNYSVEMLNLINDNIKNHPIEIVGKELRKAMLNMKKIL